MWILEGNENVPGTVHYLPCENVLIVSRKEGHILLGDDKSLSRQHASLTIKHSVENIKNPKVWPKVNLRDLGSKYGTFTNDGIDKSEKINGERIVANGDRIRFGIQQNTWRLKYLPMVVTTSVLQPASKVELQMALLKLGGHIVSDWSSECTYLVMNNITLTIKVVCALASACSIVKPDYFSKLLDAVLNKEPHPDVHQYLPPLQEMSINQTLADFSPNEHRKSVLIGLTFLFPSSKQLKKMGPPVRLAGGESFLLSQENYELVSSANFLLVQLPVDRNQEPERIQLFRLSKEIVKNKGYRVIPESDIGLAVLYISTEKHCNPTFAMTSILQRSGTSSMTQSDQGIQIYATETQDIDETPISLTSGRVIPETATTSSRRTPGTLQGPSIPLTSQSVTASLNNSSTGSTYCSMPPPLPVNVPSGTNNKEDKENVIQKSNKRSRTLSSEISEPDPKRNNTPSNRVELEDTEPLDMNDGDYDDMSEVVPLEEVSKFEPVHYSTQRKNPVSNETIKKESKLSKQTKPKEKTNNLNKESSTSQDVDNLLQDQTIARSIPFEPYTLPSLIPDQFEDIEADITNQPGLDGATEPYVTVKEEPASLPLDEPDRCSSGKRRREEEIPQSSNETSMWLGKKKRPDRTSDIHVKLENSTLSNGLAAKNKVAIKSERTNEEDLFALPATSERSRKRAEAKRKTGTEGANEDFFDLPATARTERRRKTMKSEEKEPVDLESKIAATKAAINARREEAATTASNGADAIKCNNSGKSGDWISRDNGGALDVTKSSVKVEPDVSNVSMKSEAKSENRSSRFEKSLVIVQVASLVKRPIKKSFNNSQNTSLGSLKNFKRFKKSTSDIEALPKIIGGRDLVAHDIAEVSSRNGWLRDHPDVTNIFEEREIQQRQEDAQLDALFDLPNTKVRSRRR